MDIADIVDTSTAVAAAVGCGGGVCIMKFRDWWLSRPAVMRRRERRARRRAERREG